MSAVADGQAVLPRGFFGRAALEVAPELLGCVLECHGEDGAVAVVLTEVEAYEGRDDPASHAYRGRTPRNAVMFGPPGRAYVYFTYGMHFCVNLVCRPEGSAAAVLLRAGRVIEGAPLAAARRGGSGGSGRDLARGPARLCRALAITRDLDGVDVCDQSSVLRIRPPQGGMAAEVGHGPRVGVRNGSQREWRFWLVGEATVSAYRAHVPRRRQRVSPSRQDSGTMQA